MNALLVAGLAAALTFQGGQELPPSAAPGAANRGLDDNQQGRAPAGDAGAIDGSTAPQAPAALDAGTASGEITDPGPEIPAIDAPRATPEALEAMTTAFKPLLAEAWLRELILTLGAADVGPESFEPAIDLALAAAELQPEDVEVWRVLLIAARIAEPGVPRAADLERRAVTQIARLDPRDQVAQLLRIVQAVQTFETADERLAAFRKLLTPESRQILGPGLASRIAFEQALLESRIGDTDAFARSLAEAVSLDPAFPAATELAAGFFAGRVNDPAAAAELLVAAIVANPTNRATYVDLAAILMAEGAYRSAVRILRLALIIAEGVSMEATNDITCDLALALWGAGDPTAAMTLVRNRIDRLDDEYRRVMFRFERGMPERELDLQRAPLSTLMAALWATLAQATDSPDMERAMARMAINYSARAERFARLPDGGVRQLAELSIDNAWTTLLLGGDTALVPQLVLTANTAVPMEDDALNRFVGWQRFRSGDFEGAIEALAPLAPNDNMARLGLGLAKVAHGDERDGAREILAVANAERGTALGLFAADRLFSLIQARPGPGPAAAGLDAAVAQLPQGFDRFIESASGAIGITIEPEKIRYEAFETVRFRVTITNRSQLTLAIDPVGPIQSRAACSVTVSTIGLESKPLPPALIPIDRRLELAPRESMTFTYNASLTALGVVLATRPQTGATVVARCVVNPIPADPRVRVGFMGRDIESPTVRIDGVRLDAAWLDETWAAVRQPESLLDPRRLVLLSHALLLREDVMNRPRMQELADQWTELAEAWKRLPPVAQSWVIMLLPHGEASQTFFDIAASSSDPAVLTSLLLRHVRGPRDALLDVGRRHPDERLGRLAEAVQKTIERRLEDRQRDFGLGDQPAP